MTDEIYLKKLADMQTQIKELVPDSLKENEERRMREWIMARPDEATSDMRHDAYCKGELIRCKDCRYNNRGICSWYSTLTFSWAVDDDDYCSSAERRGKKNEEYEMFV